MNKKVREVMIEWVNATSDVLQTIASGSSATRVQCQRVQNSQRALEDVLLKDEEEVITRTPSFLKK